jgi:PAS domain
MLSARLGLRAARDDLSAIATGSDRPGSPISDERLRQGYEYWRQKAVAPALPGRADIDPAEIPKLLCDLMLVDVLPDRRYRYRLIGTGNAEAHGVNATGRYLDEVLPGPEYKAHVLGLYDACVETRRPLYSESLFLSPRRREAERHTKVLFLPLAEDGRRVNMVMVMQVFRYIDERTRNRHFLEVRPYREIVHTFL